MSLDWRPWVTSAKQHYQHHIFINFWCKVKRSSKIAAWQGKERQWEQSLQNSLCPFRKIPLGRLEVFPVPGNSSPSSQELTQEQWSAWKGVFIQSNTSSCNALSFQASHSSLLRGSTDPPMEQGIPLLAGHPTPPSQCLDHWKIASLGPSLDFLQKKASTTWNPEWL